jgi:molybdopterin-guanine dinucleotide biosynthesis protein A
MMNTTFGTAVILAGGKSTRMGFDKQLLTVNEQLLCKLTVEKLRRVFPDILIVTNKPELYGTMPVRVCSDIFPNMGPVGGIHAALANARSEYIYLMACDMPVFCPEYVQYMMAQIEKNRPDICVTRVNDWIEPFNGFYRTGLLPAFEAHLRANRTSLFYLLQTFDKMEISEETARSFDAELAMFSNLNTPKDFERFCSHTQLA